MQQPIPIVFHTDLGFGHQISAYSYVDASASHDLSAARVFLEEDCDAALWINALKNEDRVLVSKNIHTNHDSFIRSLPRWPGPLRAFAVKPLDVPELEA